MLGMKTKSCEIDPFPTKLFKEILPSVIEPITKIVNISILHGICSKYWKTAVIRPLLKKIGLKLITSDYMVVSSLIFLSKLFEKNSTKPTCSPFQHKQPDARLPVSVQSQLKL